MAVPRRPLNLARRAAVAAVAPGSAQQARVSNGSLEAIDSTIIRILQEDGRGLYRHRQAAWHLRRCRSQSRGSADRIQGSPHHRRRRSKALGYYAYAMVGLKVAAGHDSEKAAHYFRKRDEVTYVIFSSPAATTSLSKSSAGRTTNARCFCASTATDATTWLPSSRWSRFPFTRTYSNARPRKDAA